MLGFAVLGVHGQHVSESSTQTKGHARRGTFAPRGIRPHPGTPPFVVRASRAPSRAGRDRGAVIWRRHPRTIPMTRQRRQAVRLGRARNVVTFSCAGCRLRSCGGDEIGVIRLEFCGGRVAPPVGRGLASILYVIFQGDPNAALHAAYKNLATKKPPTSR